MAEPATQSPYISSSAGGSGSSSESGGRDLKVSGGSSQPCADSFVSSSQPVSLFSTSQGGTTSPPPSTDKSTSKGPVPPSPVMSSSEEAPSLSLAHSTNRNETDRKSALSGAGRELVNGQKWDHFFGVSDGLGTESLSLGSPGLKEPSIESNSTAVVHTKERNNFQAEVLAGVKADLSNHDQRFPDQTPKTVSGEESKFALPTIPKKEPEGLPARVTYSHSAPIAGEAVVEKDSPESPFEVIADKLEFDKEFKDVLGSNSGNTDSNWVMHGKRELLHDIPEDGVCEFQVKPRVGGRLPSGPGLSRQSSGTTAALEEVSKCVRDLHSFTNEMLNWDLIPKDLDDKPDDSESSVPPVSLAKDSGVKADTGKASSPPRPLTISAHQKVKPPLGAEENHILVASVKPTMAASTELKADVRWPNPNPPEAADPDSSGESDDTIIEDATADPAFQNEKATEINKAPPKPAALVSVDRVTKEGPSDKNSKHVPEDGGFMPSKTPEGSWGFIDDFEDIPDKEDVLGGSPVAVSLLPKQSARGTVGQESGPQERDLFGRGSGMEGLSSSPRVGLPLDTLKEGACPDNLNGESFMDFMKECLKAKGRESPEDPVETFSEAELRAARSEVWVPRFQQPPKPTQDFEEHLTIKALMEVGRKSEMEKQSPTPSKVPSTGGRRPGHYYEMPPDPSMSAPKSALEKRPLCLEQAVDVKLASTSPGLSAHEFPGVPTKVSPASPLPYAIRKLLAEFSVHELIFWRDVKKTGLVFSTTLILLLSLAAFSVISVASYLILALLSVTISFRVYKSVIQAIQKSEDGHPFKAYLDLDVAVSSDTFHNYVSSTMVHVNHALKLIMRLFLVEDLVDSLKLAVVMWLMTYVGALFNGITLLILAELLVFSVPVVYEKYKTQIDHYVGIAREQIKSVVTKVQAKLPGVVKKKPE